MRSELYASVYAAEFPAQALLRLRPELQAQPVAVLEGRAPLERICSMNNIARKAGAIQGMSRPEAEAVAGLKLIARSTEGEIAARAILLECVASFSPRIEDAGGGSDYTCVLDIEGTERLFGEPATLARRLKTVLAAAGFRTAIAVSRNYHVARLKAVSSRGISVISEGEEANALTKMPIEVLGLTGSDVETFATWGIRTLGELAALPETDLVARLGQGGSKWRELARGLHGHTFQPIETAFELKEFCQFEMPVEQIDSLLFIGARMLDCLASRANTRALSLASITLLMELEGGRVHRRVIRPALPSIDRKFLLKLLQLELAAHPPPAAVVALTLTAEAGQSSKVQLGLFAPQTPEPSRLDVTIARLKAIAGEDRVGSPVLEDSNRPGSFHMEGFVPNDSFRQPKGTPIHMALRRMRPPIPARVELSSQKPVLFQCRKSRYVVTHVFGPWSSTGCWWALNDWDEEEWDVLAQPEEGAPIACLLVLNRSQKEWRLEAFYD